MENDIMTASTYSDLQAKKPIRSTGLYSNYKPDTDHKDTIYFATDKGQCYFNGKNYSSSGATSTGPRHLYYEISGLLESNDVVDVKMYEGNPNRPSDYINNIKVGDIICFCQDTNTDGIPDYEWMVVSHSPGAGGASTFWFNGNGHSQFLSFDLSISNNKNGKLRIYIP